MSTAPREAINMSETGIGIGQYPHQSAQNQESHGVSNLVDGSGPIFSMYLERAEEEDKKMAEHWQANADGILIFTGLFSAAVASLISVSIQDIRPNPQDTSNFYLANIYQTVADPNRSNISGSLPSSPPPFSPPNSAVWVNALWFLSLVTSITCALLATLLQQWARRYLKVTQPHYSLHKRARIRAFFAEGVDKFLLPWAVESLPTLLHVSLFLFFAGLAVFLCSVNLTIFKLVLSWIGVCTALYGFVTTIPIFYHDCPYYTPITILVWQILIGMLDIVYWVRRSFASSHHHRRVTLRRSRDRYHKLFMQGMHKTAEGTALNSQSEIDTRAFMWTFDSLDEDHELERFFSDLPGYRRSRVVADPLPSLTYEQKQMLSGALRWLLNVTFLSDLLPDPVKKRRAIICARAVDPAHIPGAFDVLDRILSNYQYSGPVATEILQIVRGWGNNGDEDAILDAQATISMIIARVQQRDDSWFILASNALGIPESVLRNYAANGNSLSLALLIHVTHQQFSHFWKRSWPGSAFTNVVEAASKFNVQDTSPELQHEFCALWNQIVLKVQKDDDRWMAFQILRPIRNAYMALHRATNSALTRFAPSTGDQDFVLGEPSLYRVCNVAGHIYDDSASTPFSRTVLNNNAGLVPASLAIPDAPSSSVLVPPRVVETLTDVPALDNEIYVPGSFHPAHRATTDTSRIPVTPPGPATAGAIPDIVTSGITMPHPTPKTSTPAPPLFSVPLPTAVTLQHNAGLLTPSDTPNLGPSLASSVPVLDNMSPTGLPQSSHSPITRPDLSPPCPEPHRPISVTTIPSASPGPTSARDLRAAAESGNPNSGSRKEKEALDPLSVNHAIPANSTTTLGLPPQSLSPPSVTDSDVVTATPPLRESNAGRTGDHPPDPSRRRYDIT